MDIIVPIDVTDGMLTSSVAITETEWSAGTYSLNDERYKGITLYKVIVSSTTDDPEVGVLANPATWENIGTINKWKMFNEKVADQTSDSEEIEVTIVPTTVVTALALINIDAHTAQVVIDDDTEGEVYNVSVDLVDIGVIDWWEYFFLTYEYLTDYVFTDLPSYLGADITVTLSTTGATVKCGELVLGATRFIGTTQFGSSVGIIDYSKKSTDNNGLFYIEEKAYSKRVDFDLDLDTSAVSSVQRFLATNRTRPLVWIGDPITEAMIVYGFFKNFNIVLSNPASASCNIQVEGLT